MELGEIGDVVGAWSGCMVMTEALGAADVRPESMLERASGYGCQRCNRRLVWLKRSKVANRGECRKE